MHDRCRFSRQIDIGFGKQPKLSEIVIEIVRAETQSQFHKDRVTGIHKSLFKIFRPMPACFMAADTAVLHDLIARAEKLSFNVTTPCSNAADAVMILNVDPGS